MKRRSAGRKFLARAWMPIVAVIAVSIGGVCMSMVHQMSAPGPVLTVNQPQAPDEFTPKTVSFEVFGSVGSGGILDYVDVDGHPHKVELIELPWEHTETTTLTVVSASISVQVHGGEVGCRIRVNDVVRDERSATHQQADVTCRVKSA